MAYKPLPPWKQKEIPKLIKKGWSYARIAKQLKICRNVCTRYKDGPAELTERVAEEQQKPSLSRSDDVTKNAWSIELKQTRIHTLDELMKYCEVDLDLWEVERFVCNKWEVGAKDKDNKIQVEPLYQVKAWLKKRVEVAAAKAAVERFILKAEQYAPKFPHIIRMRSKSSSGVWIEPSIYDHHFGALIWAKETGHDDYDSAIARKCWGDALACLLDRTESFKPEGACFPIGNDYYNANNRKGSTEKDTLQSMDSRYEKLYEVGVEAAKFGIDQMLARGLKVHVPIVRGNHDVTVIWHLGHDLESWYRNNPRVTIDNRPTKRKWFEHGVNMLMFAHGDTGKLEDYGKTMAAEQPEMWGRTKWREAHTGDKHQKRLIEQPGCIVRILSSLRPPCAWSAENMYQSIRAAECFAWSKTEGLIGEAHYSILPGQLKKLAA